MLQIPQEESHSQLLGLAGSELEGPDTPSHTTAIGSLEGSALADLLSTDGDDTLSQSAGAGGMVVTPMGPTASGNSGSGPTGGNGSNGGAGPSPVGGGAAAAAGDGGLPPRLSHARRNNSVDGIMSRLSISGALSSLGASGRQTSTGMVLLEDAEGGGTADAVQGLTEAVQSVSLQPRSSTGSAIGGVSSPTAAAAAAAVVVAQQQAGARGNGHCLLPGHLQAAMGAGGGGGGFAATISAGPPTPNQTSSYGGGGAQGAAAGGALQGQAGAGAGAGPVCQGTGAAIRTLLELAKSPPDHVGVHASLGWRLVPA